MWIVVSTLLLALLALVSFRLFLSWHVKNRQHLNSVRTLVVLGSGGHTSEMLGFLQTLPIHKYSPRCYIVAATDKGSATKAVAFEQQLPSNTSQYSIEHITRSREVGQSYLTSVLTTSKALMHAVTLLNRQRPQLVSAHYEYIRNVVRHLT